MLGVLDLGIDLDVWPWVWIGVAVVFALIELTALAGSFVLLPFAVTAFFASLAGFYDAPVELQWAIFFLGGALLWYLFWQYSKTFANNDAMPEGVGADRLVGMTAIVISTIDPNDVDRRGRVKVLGEDWGALTTGDQRLVEGSKVKITSMNGTRVMVEAVAGTPSSEPPMGPPQRSNVDPNTKPSNTNPSNANPSKDNQ